jgi:lipid II:glycine glycyltransferase (peptidoglycan interpeptide bridge formation enzyme)
MTDYDSGTHSPGDDSEASHRREERFFVPANCTEVWQLGAIVTANLNALDDDLAMLRQQMREVGPVIADAMKEIHQNTATLDNRLRIVERSQAEIALALLQFSEKMAEVDKASDTEFARQQWEKLTRDNKSAWEDLQREREEYQDQWDENREKGVGWAGKS